jgi:uncharacterized protein YyaL (SSP411 family)
MAYANRLSRESSPYLLQHAHNPVDWYPWGDEAFAKARTENKPIFLSIGYATCHWCHVMERESFEDPEIARILTDHFVSVKVDREERPDVDKIYMTAVQAMTGQGGWPLSAWLTPELEPFYGGTYFPPESRHGRPSFRQILLRIAELWKERAEELRGHGRTFVSQLREMGTRERLPGRLDDVAVLDAAARRFKAEFDPNHGGFGGAPKFPRPSTPWFLLHHADRTGDAEALRMVKETARGMIRGGIHDHVGGGFHRYAVDERWLVPHFEKMLYDNGLLMGLFSDLHRVEPDGELAEAVAGIDRWLSGRMAQADGGYHSAEDADSEGREGLYYVWRVEELEEVLTGEEWDLVRRVCGCTKGGNFLDHSDPDPLPGLNVLSIEQPPRSAEEGRILKGAWAKLGERRSRRVPPLLDDKVLASWNGLVLSGYARAFRAFRRPEYLEKARRLAGFLETRMTDPETGLLRHCFRQGRLGGVTLLDDYAFCMAGLVDLYEADPAVRWLRKAMVWADDLIRLFGDAERGGFWQSLEGDPHLPARVKEDYDGAEPSGNSVAAVALWKLADLTGEDHYREAARGVTACFRDRLEQLPAAVPHLLVALDLAVRSPVQAVVAGNPDDPATRVLAGVLEERWDPGRITVWADVEHPSPLVRAQASAGGPPRVYLCRNFACGLPVVDPEELRRQLARPV